MTRARLVHCAQAQPAARIVLAAVLVAIFCLPGARATAGDGDPAAAPQLDEFVIYSGPGQQWQLAANSWRVVWVDTRNGQSDLYGMDLHTRSEFQVSTAPGEQVIPDMSSSVVVWQDRRDDSVPPNIYGYNLDTQAEFPICIESHGQLVPAINDNLVVWQDSRNGSNNQDIYGYDLATGTEFPISTSPASQVGAAIYGNIVVWMDYRNEPVANCWPNCNTDIYGYNLATGQEFPICTDTHYQGPPAVYGNTVVWIDDRNGNDDVYGYNLATGQEFAICTEPHDQIGVAIGPHWIVWIDERNEPDPDNCGSGCNYDLYGLKSSGGAEVPLVVGPNAQTHPVLSGDLLVWADTRNEPDPLNCGSNCNYDVYGAALGPGEGNVARGHPQSVDPGEEIILTFSLPMDTATVSYECTPDPGGWVETWEGGAARQTYGSVLHLGHQPFTLGTSYVLTVTAGQTVFGQAIEPFGFEFKTYAVRVYLPLVLR